MATPARFARTRFAARQLLLRARASCVATLAASATFLSANVQAAPLDISDAPLFLQDSVAPLNLLVLGRDHKLYYEAYNDHSDLDGKNDGPNNTKTLEIGYSPAKIDYFGYFDSKLCYTYGTELFTPTRRASGKKCGGTGEWSGDWLNYVTTARIDAMRKVLYGGSRSTDTATSTILQRSHIPQDAHSWGKEYTSEAVDGYNIRDYTPYDAPTSGRHLFANTTLMLDDTAAQNWSRPPLLRVALNQGVRIWNWVSVESPVAGACVNHGLCSQVAGQPDSESGPGTRITIEDKVVRVEVCKGTDADPATTLHEDNCRKYGTSYKPIGLLQEYGENDAMLFGLLTGSYQKSKSGGVMRKNMGSIGDEINAADGTFTATNGIIQAIDKLKATGFEDYRGNSWYDTAGRGAGTTYLPGLKTDGPFNEGQFGGMWGNPVAEMMYEGLRYFAGKGAPTPEFHYSNSGSFDNALGLPRLSSNGGWTDPYGGTKPACAKPFELVMSDINMSYDSDQLPGSSYPVTLTGSQLTDLNVSTLADKIWTSEYGSGNRKVFIGQSTTSNYDGSPSPKDADRFSTLRGLAPEEPTKQGSYYAASVANFGYSTDINSKTSNQKVQTFAVALASPLPRIEIKTASGLITLVPFGKSVGGNSISAAQGAFQPTNQIVDFYVESLTATSGTFQVNFEDVEAGNDHDMDAVVRYSYSVSGDTVTVNATSDYAAGGIIQHMGYVVSGSNADGIYLVVRDRDTAAGADVQYFLDTPDGINAGGCNPTLCAKAGDGSALPLASTKTFTSGTTSATLLKDPLWYAAKWGGFKDENKNGVPDDAQDLGNGVKAPSEWDANGDGNPDNYFLVTNALNLGAQLREAFQEILKSAGSASSASVNSGSISSDTRVYQATFNYDDSNWSGELLAYGLDVPTGKLNATADWKASGLIPAYDSRVVLTTNSDGTPVKFRWDDLDDTRRQQIEPSYVTTGTAAETLGKNRLNYLRGDQSLEVGKTNGVFRKRPSRLGDIVASSPIYVGRPPFYYADNLESTSKPYSKFRSANGKDKDGKDQRAPMVYTGANDGMLHAFDAKTGVEKLAFIPTAAYRNLRTLSNTDYAHKYFVDAPPNMGDVFIDGDWQTVLLGGLNRGGQEIYALNITDPKQFDEGSAEKIVMWEFSDADDADLGYTYAQPSIVRLQNGKWGAIFGNGYNNTEADGIASSTGNAVLYVVDIESGDLVAKLDTMQGAAQDPSALNRPNGLSTPAVIDIDGDENVDYVYAGDLFGNLWKFDIRDNNPANWKSSYGTVAAPTPLFTALDHVRGTIHQPITSRPEVVRGPRGVGVMVLFGTGKYVETGDKTVNQADKRYQTYYGLHDVNTGTSTDLIADRTLLTQQTILAEGNYTFTQDDGATVKRDVRVTSKNTLTANKGWYINLLSPSGYQGERQVSNTAVRAGRVIFTTLVPTADPCGNGGTSWLMEMDALTGARLDSPPFDFNNDGQFDNQDMIPVVIGGVTVMVPASGTDMGVGITPEPGILLGEGGAKEFKYNPGTSGQIGVTTENPGPRARGRQSWRQIR